MFVRDEEPGDADAVRFVNDSAFGRTAEGATVDAIRSSCDGLVSLVGVAGGTVVGHILFSPVELVETQGKASLSGMGLAPMAVLPSCQRQGIGSMLVREGVARIRARGTPFVVVLGHPQFYPRFGFEQASKFHVRCPWNVPEDAFMLMAFQPDAIPAGGGTIYYRAEFELAK